VSVFVDEVEVGEVSENERREVVENGVVKQHNEPENHV
jgi:hypothetical protein